MIKHVYKSCSTLHRRKQDLQNAQRARIAKQRKNYTWWRCFLSGPFPHSSCPHYTYTRQTQSYSLKRKHSTHIHTAEKAKREKPAGTLQKKYNTHARVSMSMLLPSSLFFPAKGQLLCSASPASRTATENSALGNFLLFLERARARGTRSFHENWRIYIRPLYIYVSLFRPDPKHFSV